MIFTKQTKVNKSIYYEVIIPTFKLNKVGVAHLLEHLIMKNNTVYSKEYIRKKRHEYEITAETFFEYIKFSCYVSKEDFISSVKFLSNLLYNTKIDDEWRSELIIIKDEIEMGDKNIYSQNYVSICENVLNFNANILGNIDELSKIKTSELISDYNNLIKQPIDIVVVGNIKGIKVEKILNKYFNCYKNIIFNKKPYTYNNKEMYNNDTSIYNFIFTINNKITNELNCRNLQYFSYLYMNEVFKDKNQIFYNFYTNYIVCPDIIVFYFSFYCDSQKVKLLQEFFPEVLNKIRKTTENDFYDLIKILNKEKMKFCKTNKDPMVYENIKNHNVLLTEFDILNYRIKKITFKEFKKFLIDMFN